MTYGLNDICIIPARISEVEHRGDCNPFNTDNKLPLFTAPMNAVINEDNYKIFLKNNINTIIPRGVNYNIRWELSTKTFVAVSLEEFVKFIEDYTKIFNQTTEVRYVCVDIANGHMKKLIDLCAKAKDLFGGRLLLMAGNIANPNTYIEYAKAGIDFVRISIGTGNACLTSCNTGIHYGLASLIKSIYHIKCDIINNYLTSKKLGCESLYNSIPFIVADGGFDNYDKIIKALALGADYVMIGKLFAQCEEACYPIQYIECISPEGYITMHDNIPKNIKWIYDNERELYVGKYRSYYGMSTKKAQKETNCKTLKTSEGIEFNVPILYNLSGWCDNFISYLRSAMSYTNSFNLDDFKNSEYQIISISEYLSFNK